MSELEKLEQKIVSLFEENSRAMDQKFKGMDDRFDRIEERLGDVEIDIKMICIEMQSESNRIQETIHKEVQRLDDKIHDLEISDREKWNIPELKDRLDVVEHFASEHSRQIKELTVRIN